MSLALVQPQLEAVTAACRKHHVAHLHAFGSVLRPDYRPGESDIALLVDLLSMDASNLYRAYFALLNDLRQGLASRVDLVMADAVRNPPHRQAGDRCEQITDLCSVTHAGQLVLMHNQFRETLWPCRGAEVFLADRHRRTVPYVGPVEVRFRNRRCFTGAMVLGNEVLLGAIPMADMDLVLRPQLQSVDVNPESPNIPLSVAATPFEEMQVENKRDPQTAEVVLTPLPPSLTALSVRRYALHSDPDFQAEIRMFGAGLRDSRPAGPVQWTW